VESARYDSIADEYAATFTQNADPDSVWSVAVRHLLELLDPVVGEDICDLACGEGSVARQLASRGAKSVVGVDVSMRLLEHARQRTQTPNVRYVRDNAQGLHAFVDAAFDAVACNLALMDIPDLAAVYATAFRILRPGGRFVFSLTHPCFQMPGVPVDGASGTDDIRYHDEGHWRSEYATGIRGRVGAYHRTLSSYINGLTVAGFTVTELVEPQGALRVRAEIIVSSLLLVRAEKRVS
jgi:ubiquinone/menaquinone biosynthesis C-methylase UbiE